MEKELSAYEKDKYQTICEIILLARYINMVHPEPIYFTSSVDKYKGWEGTMKPSY